MGVRRSLLAFLEAILDSFDKIAYLRGCDGHHPVYANIDHPLPILLCQTRVGGISAEKSQPKVFVEVSGTSLLLV